MSVRARRGAARKRRYVRCGHWADHMGGAVCGCCVIVSAPCAGIGVRVRVRVRVRARARAAAHLVQEALDADEHRSVRRAVGEELPHRVGAAPLGTDVLVQVDAPRVALQRAVGRRDRRRASHQLHDAPAALQPRRILVQGAVAARGHKSLAELV
eukprot:4338868-Prymnesium_polylepis.1